jgi:hypothetical protein
MRPPSVRTCAASVQSRTFQVQRRLAGAAELQRSIKRPRPRAAANLRLGAVGCRLQTSRARARAGTGSWSATAVCQAIPCASLSTEARAHAAGCTRLRRTSGAVDQELAAAAAADMAFAPACGPFAPGLCVI